MTIKVGVQGRAIVGPLGEPGTVDVPLRYAVVREGPEPKTIVTKFKRTSVTIAQGERHAQFVDIEEALSFPLPPSTELEAYVVYVGFDEVGDPREKKPARTGKNLHAFLMLRIGFLSGASCNMRAILSARGPIGSRASISRTR